MIAKTLYNVVSSGSAGNCEIAKEVVMIDCGVPFSHFKKYYKQLKLVIVTHSHLDHLNMSAIKKLSYERPTIRFAIGAHLQEKFEGIPNVDVLNLGVWYDYEDFRVSIGKLYHDIPNVFVRLDFDGYKIFRATDTAHLEGISAKNYDLYAIEANYDEDTVWDNIRALESQGKFSHQRGSIETHLSYQQARDFYFSNRKDGSELIRLHESKSF